MSTNTYTTFETHEFDSDEFRDDIREITEEDKLVDCDWRPFSGGWNEKLHRNVFSFSGKKHTPEWKETHSKKMSGKNNPMYGKTRTRDSNGRFIKKDGINP